jgi:hypothetical protein
MSSSCDISRQTAEVTGPPQKDDNLKTRVIDGSGSPLGSSRFGGKQCGAKVIAQ